MTPETPAAPFKSVFLRKLGYLVWLTLFLMALFFYKERAFFMDAGFQLFNLINEEAIQVYHHRFVTALPQILPYFLLKLDAPLGLLGMSFSGSYILFYLLIYHLLVKYLKNDQLGWVLILLFTLLSYDTFYHIQSEFYLGLSLLLLTFGLVLFEPALKKGKTWLFILPLLVSVGFSHKLSLVFFVFLWLFFGLTYTALHHKRYLILLGVFILVAAFKTIFFTNWYEAAKQIDFKNNWNTYFPDFHTLPSNAVFLKRCLWYYYMLPVILLGSTIFYLKKREWVKTGLMWAFSLGFLLLYNISDPAASYRFYSEVTYLPLSIFVAVPLLFDVIPAISSRPAGRYTGAFFVTLMILRLGSIVSNQRTFDRMFTWIQTQTAKAEKYGTNRLFIRSENAPVDTVLMEWGVPFTAMHLSALKNPEAAKTLLILPDFEKYRDLLEEDHYFLTPFKAMDLKELNEKYYDPGKAVYREIE